MSKTAIYCNDRANEKYSTTEDFFCAPYQRVVSALPSYKCGNDRYGNLYTGENGANGADKFTGSTSTGNGKLKDAPVALMTADELIFAGAEHNAITSPGGYYAFNAKGTNVTKDTVWWTMSPYGFYDANSSYGMYTGMFLSGRNASIQYVVVSAENAVRPVLSLKSCVKWKSGNGTSDNPYTVDTLDSTCTSAEN